MRLTILGLIGLLLATNPVMALEGARDYIERGHTVLTQARREAPGQRREKYLSEAIAAFANAYEIGGQQSKSQALMGAAQGYLLRQKAPARFPFLWSASPLQRARKSLQQVLALQPDNSTANLLMGLVLWRQAEHMPEQRTAYRQRSLLYLQRAAELGLPVQATTHPGAAAAPSHFTVGDRIVALRQVEARGTGEPQDTLFVYCLAQNVGACYGVIVGAGTTYALRAVPALDVIVPADVLEVRIIKPKVPGPQRIVVLWQGEGQPAETSFVWESTRFVPVQTPPETTSATRR